jgi:2-hydroxychromene-2-carboxylate isomerase
VRAGRECSQPGQPIFYYDLGSLACYLAAERIMAELPVVPEWEPVFGPDLGVAQPAADRQRWGLEVDAQGLQPLRWPADWPPDTRLAMLAATYAKRVGRAVAFSLAAFRQAFAGGRDLGDEDTVLIAAAACEMHPKAVLSGIGMRSVVSGLELAGKRARDGGVASLPAIQVGELVFEGVDSVQRAAVALGAVS